MKKKRHSMILKLIEMYAIGTQEEMLEKLEENGFSSTQATVSRDIKELRLVKQMDKNGVYRYVEGKSETDEYLSKFTIRSFPRIMQATWLLSSVMSAWRMRRAQPLTTWSGKALSARLQAMTRFLLFAEPKLPPTS